MSGRRPAVIATQTPVPAPHPIAAMSMPMPSPKEISPSSLQQLVEALQRPDQASAVSPAELARFVSAACKQPLSPPAHAELCRLIMAVFSTKAIPLNESYGQHALLNSIDFLLGQLGSSRIDSAALLKTLGVLLFENSVLYQQQHTKLVGTLVPLVSDSSVEVQRMAIVCLGNICAKLGTKSHAVGIEINRVLMAKLAAFDGTEKIMQSIKLLVSLLKAINFTLADNKALVAESLPQLLPVVHLCCFPQVNLTILTGMIGWGKTGIISSDSELSDSEAGSSKQALLTRLQQTAMMTLFSLAKTTPKLLYPHWSKFLPEHLPTTPNLVSHMILNADEPIKLRILACDVIMAMLDGSKQYLSVASESTGKTPYTSLSQKLADQIRDLHLSLIRALQTVPRPVYPHVIKTLNALVQNCAYDRLATDYRNELYQAVCVDLQGSDVHAKTAVLELLGSLVDAEMVLNEASRSLVSMDELVGQVTVLTQPQIHLAVRAAAFEFLCAVARSTHDDLKMRWISLDDTIFNSAKDSLEAIRVAALKLLEQYLHSTRAGEEWSSSPEWWVNMLTRYIQPALNDPFYAVRALGCDILSNVPEKAFEGFEPKQQYAFLTLALGMAQDDDSPVVAAACRTLGVYVLYEPLAQDMEFVLDVASTVTPHVSSSSLPVRIRASWALANVAEVLATRFPEAQDVESSALTEELVADMIKTSIVAAKDNDKCRSSGVRAIGNLVLASSRLFLSRERESLVKASVQVVIKNIESGTVKTRWNACYAVSNMLAHSDFPIGTTTWTPMLYQALFTAIQKSKNFKVRINATLALMKPRQRGWFGTRRSGLLRTALVTLTEAMEGINDFGEVDFGEFKYQEHLGNQLRATFDHLWAIYADETESWVAGDDEQLLARMKLNPNYKRSIEPTGGDGDKPLSPDTVVGVVSKDSARGLGRISDDTASTMTGEMPGTVGS
ncbi:armadillo-type protein [Polychytrium aggregatum]|uniref:armadillo-type protein n=1 Tax=Polychytrium aggregatum TaxID=110093 RepID=UPI0022FF0287|nr:armadillo-type protein [Polychytrium aggregatum]KAI9206071.1 armadillo-type protein [Polychytrium aggregatum]